MTAERWKKLMASMGVLGGMETYEALVTAYAEKHRHYHTQQHIDHCLSELDLYRHLANSPEEVELALWFHDAIYEPYSSDNEANSANLACDFLERHSIPAERIERIRELILATRHQALPMDSDSRLLIDVDLAILGSDQQLYAQFETNVRREYKWVPRIVYRRTRAKILQSFLDRPSIYSTKPFIERYEDNAHLNLSNAIVTLKT